MIELIRRVATNPETPWVLFEHGTAVFLREPDGDLEAAARELLREWGPVHAGGPAGDFSVIALEGGWAVTCHHPDILTFVGPDEGAAEELMVGLLGRQKRDQDAGELQVVHVEVGRP